MPVRRDADGAQEARPGTPPGRRRSHGESALGAWVADDGQGLAEHSLILGFIFLACVIALSFLGAEIFGGITDLLPGFG